MQLVLFLLIKMGLPYLRIGIQRSYLILVNPTKTVNLFFA